MISTQRIWAIVLRYIYTTRDPARIVEFVFWPMIDIGFMGLIALWSGQIAKDPNLVTIFVSALILWQVIYRAHFEICVNILDEFLEHNLLNLLASPLKKSEWILAMMCGGFIKILFSLMFGALIGYLFFQVNIFQTGPFLIPFILLCLLSGWIIGFFGAGFVIYKGPKLQQLPWVIIMVFAIFSAVFYPLNVLHPSLQFIAQALPMSYIFQGMRELLVTGTFSWKLLGISTVLSIFYLFLAIKFFLYMFSLGRRRGFHRLT